MGVQSVSTAATATEVPPPPVGNHCQTCGVEGHVTSKCPEAAFMRRMRAKQTRAMTSLQFDAECCADDDAGKSCSCALFCKVRHVQVYRLQKRRLQVLSMVQVV